MSNIDVFRRIVDNKSAEKVDVNGNEVLVDLFGASVVVQVHDRLSPKFQANFVSRSIPEMYELAFKVYNNAKGS